jgi:hypothetical protein
MVAGWLTKARVQSGCPGFPATAFAAISTVGGLFKPSWPD